jgi:pimeloyl-ACP methyl ester carboxylesterase
LGKRPMPYLETDLPSGIRSRFVDSVNGLTVHILESGHETSGRPCLLLLHGFPELAYSWRAVMPALASAGYYVVAPDQRGYGRTTGWEGGYDADLEPFTMMNLARDATELVAALGLPSVAAVIGHDFGSPVAAHCALTRPLVFRRLVMMSAPFPGPPTAPAMAATSARNIHAELAALARPRKLYQWYYSTPSADTDMRGCLQGLAAFLRAYYHVKSADWAGNRPSRLGGWNADELARLPAYYAMNLTADMAAAVAPFMPSPGAIAACRWLTDAELSVYVSEFERTGFQGGLQWYRCGTGGLTARDLAAWSGQRIEPPAVFIAGAADWGIYQTPGALEAMQTRACADFRAVRLIEGAGHWVQQEQPDAVVREVLGFLAETAKARAKTS